MSKKEIVLNYIGIGSKYLEQMKFYKCLGSFVNGDNSTEEEIKEKIAPGDKAFMLIKKIFKSKLVPKKAKLKLCWTIIRAVITCASKKWLLKETMK